MALYDTPRGTAVKPSMSGGPGGGIQAAIAQQRQALGGQFRRRMRPFSIGPNMAGAAGPAGAAPKPAPGALPGGPQGGFMPQVKPGPDVRPPGGGIELPGANTPPGFDFKPVPTGEPGGGINGAPDGGGIGKPPMGQFGPPPPTSDPGQPRGVSVRMPPPPPMTVGAPLTPFNPAVAIQSNEATPAGTGMTTDIANLTQGAAGPFMQDGGMQDFSGMTAGNGPETLSAILSNQGGIPGSPSGPIMDPMQAPTATSVTSDPMQPPGLVGRGGNVQQAGAGRYGGAPPANVLARRQQIMQRMRALQGGG